MVNLFDSVYIAGITLRVNADMTADAPLPFFHTYKNTLHKGINMQC